MAQNYARYTFKDRSGDMSSLKIFLPEVGAGNLDTINAGIDALAGAAFGITLKNLTLDVPESSELVVATTKYPSGNPTSPWAKNENGLRVKYQDDTTGKYYHVTIPAPDWATIGIANSDMVDPTNAAWLAFVAAFNAFAASPDGNGVTVIEGRYVGRSR